jgi:hypothetical protein
MQTQTTDRWALLISQACAIHCILLPILGMAFPVLALFSRQAAPLEWVFWGCSLALAAFSLTRSYRRHGRWLPLALASLGLILLALTKLTYDQSYQFVPFRGHMLMMKQGLGLRLGAGCLLFAAHALNIHYTNAWQEKS